VIVVDMVVMHVWMSISWVFKYSLTKTGKPTGEPRRRETSGEFGREWRAQDIDIVRFGRVPGDGIGD
jgi:hypothetical protein